MVSQLVLGMIAFLPGIAVLYAHIGQHEAHFRHNAMFLCLLGGMALGLAGSFVELIVMSESFYVIAMLAAATVETMAKTMVVGLPRFRGHNETVLLGGATGLGVAALTMMAYSQTLRAEPASWRLWTTLVSVSIGFTLVHHVSGMLLGQGPAEGRLLSRFLPSLGVLLPAHILLMIMGLDPATDTMRPLLSYQNIEFGLLLLGYGLLLFWLMGPKLAKRGLPEEEQKRLRRQALKEKREQRDSRA